MSVRRSIVLLVAAVAVGCITSKQRVRIQCVPQRVSVYVDGRLLEPATDEVRLRTDVPHKIFAKGAGYEPRLVVLEPERDADGRLHFPTDELCIEVVPIGQNRAIELEAERDAENGKRP